MKGTGSGIYHVPRQLSDMANFTYLTVAIPPMQAVLHKLESGFMDQRQLQSLVAIEAFHLITSHGDKPIKHLQ